MRSRATWPHAVLRLGLAAAMVTIGVLHFTHPAPFVRIVPAALPAPLALVYLSGAAEVLLGAGLLVPRTRRLASYGLVALFVAVFPANINMAVNDLALDPESPTPSWVAWARLPFQLVFIAWALYVGRPSELAVAARRDEAASSRAPSV